MRTLSTLVIWVFALQTTLGPVAHAGGDDPIRRGGSQARLEQETERKMALRKSVARLRSRLVGLSDNEAEATFLYQVKKGMRYIRERVAEELSKLTESEALELLGGLWQRAAIDVRVAERLEDLETSGGDAREQLVAYFSERQQHDFVVRLRSDLARFGSVHKMLDEAYASPKKFILTGASLYVAVWFSEIAYIGWLPALIILLPLPAFVIIDALIIVPILLLFDDGLKTSSKKAKPSKRPRPKAKKKSKP